MILLLAIFLVSIYTDVLTHVMYKGMSRGLTTEDFTEINDISDKNTELYTNLQSYLNEIRNLNSTRYFYTAKRGKYGKLIYLVDGLDKGAKDFRNPGDHIEKEMIPYIKKGTLGSDCLFTRYYRYHMGTYFYSLLSSKGIKWVWTSCRCTLY